MSQQIRTKKLDDGLRQCARFATSKIDLAGQAVVNFSAKPVTRQVAGFRVSDMISSGSLDRATGSRCARLMLLRWSFLGVFYGAYSRPIGKVSI
jgi:hypothetical protein